MIARMTDTRNETLAKNGQHDVQTPRSSTNPRPDPQVAAPPARRRFTAEYKRRILKEADACTRYGQLGELLRREGLYSSTLTSFRKQQSDGRLDRADPQIRRAQRKQSEAARQRDARRIARLESENQKLRALIDLQKKLSDLIGVPLLTQTSE
jgi:transposase-like protein